MNFDIKTKIKSIRSLKENKHLIAAFFLLIGISIYISHMNKSELIKDADLPIQADTILPKGFILYPIRLENMEAIKGVIDQYGVIDVYLGSKNGYKSKKLLSKVKIMQAPYNPNEYALMIPEYLSEKLIAESGPFLGVIQNKSVTTDISNSETETKIKKISIEYQKGS